MSAVSSSWPFPSTPATPTISPAWTSRLSVSKAFFRSFEWTTRSVNVSTGLPSYSETAASSTPVLSMSLTTRPRAAPEDRKDTSRPTIERASPGASASLVSTRSTTRPDRMIVISSVAPRTSFSLWLTRATARFSSCTACRRTSKSCSDSAGVNTEVGSSKMIMSGSRRRHFMISTLWRSPTGRSATTASDSIPSP